MEPEFGYPQLARALRRSADPRTLDAQLHELFLRMIFNILVANTDDHEKNHALLCHISGRTMKLELSREPRLSEAMTVVDDFDLSPLEAANAVLKIIAVVNDWQSHFRSLGVTAADLGASAVLGRKRFGEARDSLRSAVESYGRDETIKSPSSPRHNCVGRY